MKIFWAHENPNILDFINTVKFIIINGVWVKFLQKLANIGKHIQKDFSQIAQSIDTGNYFSESLLLWVF